MGSLFLVATPIGNLEDITLRALRVLGQVSLIAAEDTRQTRKLLSHYQLSAPLVSYHEHSKRTRLDAILAALDQGDVALTSDAGTPGLSDPGYELVRAALQAGHRVIPIPGASAPMTALVASGLPPIPFVFLGYLPRRATDRRKLLQQLACEERTLVLFESPHRLRAALGDLVAALGPERPAAVGRELTKLHEEIQRGSLRQLSAHFDAVEPRGEFTLVIAGAPQEGPWTEGRVRQALAETARAGLSASAAAKAVAAQSGWPRQRVYRMILEEE